MSDRPRTTRSRVNSSLVSIATVLALSAAAFAQSPSGNAAGSAPPREALGHDDLAPAAKSKPPVISPALAYDLDLRALTPVGLPALSDEELRRIVAEDEADAYYSKVVRYGVRRELIADTRSAGGWIDVAGEGLLWVTDIVVEGAIGVRVQFRDFALPSGGELYVYSTDHPERVWGPYTGLGVMDQGEFWTPTTFGERVRVEYWLPYGAASDPAALLSSALAQPPFRIDGVQHIYRDPIAAAERVGACHNDVSCYSAWANVARASAGIGTVNQNSLWCSGTMIAATAADQTPYWLTANHCISSASTATNAEIYWLYQTSSCNGSVPSIATVPQSAVCTRLSYSATSDYSLLMVEGAIPDGLFWAGWTSTAVANGTNVTCIHHPDGSWKRISFATKISGAAANFIRADWYDAPTEPGSSGSGLFRSDTQQLVGQLYGGPSSCADESYDDYGAFATTYSSMSSLLAAGSDDAYEQNDTCATARTMTAGTYSNLVVKRFASGDEDWYAISVGAGQTLTLSLSLTHNNGDVEVQLYQSCGGTLLGSSTGNTNSESITWTNSGASAVSVRARVYLSDDTRNTYSMTISFGGGGGGNNDNCANATPVTNGTYTGSTASATRDGSASCGSSSTTRDVWYRYTAGAAGTLRVNTCGSSYDTVVSLHSGCPGTTSNQLTCNDDCGGSPCGGVSSCVSRTVTAGQVVYIRISGYNGASGSFTMAVSGP